MGAALAAAEWVRETDGPALGGREFLTAVLVGYELSVRVSQWVGFGPEHEIGWHTPAYHPAIGAAATCATLMRLNGHQTAHALAIATDLAGGGLTHSRNDAKRVHTGRAAQTGIIAAVLASEEIEAGLDVLEHPRWGYARALRYGTAQSNYQAPSSVLGAGLFEDWGGYEQLAIKYYPFHSVCQTIIDNVARLKRDHKIQPNDVTHAVIDVSSFVHDHDAMLLPAGTLATANFSLPYALALAVCHHVPRLSDEASDPVVYIEGFSDECVQRLQRLVDCRRSDILDQESEYTMDSIVTLTLSGGKNVQTRTEYGRVSRARGGASAVGFDDVSDTGLKTKFRNLCLGTFAESRGDEIVALVDALHEQVQLDELLSYLGADESAHVNGAARRVRRKGV